MPDWSSWSRASRACSPTIPRRSLTSAPRPMCSGQTKWRWSTPARTCPNISMHWRRRSAAGRSRRSCARTPTGITALRPRPLADRHRRADRRLRSAGPGNGRPARRRVVRRRLSARPRARGRRGDRGRRQAGHRGRDPRAHIQPFVLRLRRCLVHRRSCDGLVDHRRRPARRRHGRLYARASTSFGSAATGSIIRRTGRRSTNPQQYVRGLIGHRMQREKQILKLVGERPRDIPDIVANAYPALDQRLVPAAGGSVFAHFWTSKSARSLNAKERLMDRRKLIGLARDRRRAGARRHARHDAADWSTASSAGRTPNHRQREPRIDARAEPADRLRRALCFGDEQQAGASGWAGQLRTDFGPARRRPLRARLVQAPARRCDLGLVATARFG